MEANGKSEGSWSKVEKKMAVIRLRIGLCGAGYAMLATVAGCTLFNPVLFSVSTGSGNGIIQLMSQAEQIVQQDYPDSLLIEVIGEPTSGAANSAEDVDSWEFRFVDDINASNVGTVILHYANGVFDDPEHINQGLVGTIYERVPRVMSLKTAIELMRKAGYSDTFSTVVLRKPLTNPEPIEAFYIFSLPGRLVLVGMVTGEVTVE
jgi:hypothetical protein